MSNKSKNYNNYTLTNYIQYFNLTYDYAKYNLIIQYNNSWNSQFLLMNHHSILNYTNKDKYYFCPYQKCVAATAYNSCLFALCQDTQQNTQIMRIYQMQLTILFQNLKQQRIQQIQPLVIILELELQIICSFLSVLSELGLIITRLKAGGEFICKSTQFGFQSIQIEEKDGGQYQFIIIQAYSQRLIILQICKSQRKLSN
ncbi:unnamed protein product [Paramecium octaurelia]|uniref:Uncharacterized protein n=1 Tax=Paramecium octaurelia TaxID=43137 RepID=A0A8S1SVH6_PAROT|nr:unnamed protein product [Paramecium octaurelia]